MSQWHYKGCGCIKDSNWQELDSEMVFCDQCISEMPYHELPDRLKDDAIKGDIVLDLITKEIGLYRYGIETERDIARNIKTLLWNHGYRMSKKCKGPMDL